MSRKELNNILNQIDAERKKEELKKQSENENEK